MTNDDIDLLRNGFENMIISGNVMLFFGNIFYYKHQNSFQPFFSCYLLTYFFLLSGAK